jgi:hypothetical protein
MRRLIAILISISLASVVLLGWQWFPWRKTDLNDEFTGLPESLQEHIWELEHVTFELEAKFGKAVTLAMRDGRTDDLQRFLMTGFSAELPAERVTSAEASWWTETRFEEGLDHRAADANEFAEYLVGTLSKFDHIEQLKLKVLSIDKNDTASGTQSWDLRFLLLARGSTQDGGVSAFESEHLVRCRFSDDEDIEQGRIVETWRVKSEFFRSVPKPFFVEATKAFGLDQLGMRDNWKPQWDPVRTYSLQVGVEDYDRDGYLDIAVSGLDGKQMLLRGDGTSFTDVTTEVGLPQYRSKPQVALANWFDFDNDGYPDLLLGDSLYRNDRGTRFINVTNGSGLQFLEETMGCAIADYDADGKLDLYILHHRSAMQTDRKIGYIDDAFTGAENRLYRNLGYGRFEDVTETAGVGAGQRHSFAATWLDANDDRLPDLYVANDFGANQLFVNDGNGRFHNIADQVGVGDFATSMGVASGDLDGDGTAEIYVANMFSKMGRRIIAHVQETDYPAGVYAQIQGSCAGNRLYRRRSSGEDYEEISELMGVSKVGWAYAPALVDLDSDGWLDIYATCGFLSFDSTKPDG